MDFLIFKTKFFANFHNLRGLLKIENSFNLPSIGGSRGRFWEKYFEFLDVPLTNNRQKKVLHRIFDEGIERFSGGLSASNYKVITGASSASVTRDLQELVQMNAMTKTGELKHTRYFVNYKI